MILNENLSFAKGSIEKLCAVLGVHWAVDGKGTRLPGNARVSISDERIKTVLHDHRTVVPLARTDQTAVDWVPLSPAEYKRY